MHSFSIYIIHYFPISIRWVFRQSFSGEWVLSFLNLYWSLYKLCRFYKIQPEHIYILTGRKRIWKNQLWYVFKKNNVHHLWPTSLSNNYAMKISVPHKHSQRVVMLLFEEINKHSGQGGMSCVCQDCVN